jgi:hypothetical protein
MSNLALVKRSELWDCLNRGESIHDAIRRIGLDKARELARSSKADREAVETVARMAALDVHDPAVAYAGFAMTSLPHSAPMIFDESLGRNVESLIWERANGPFRMMIQANKVMVGSANIDVGIPYGAYARLILVHVMTEAMKGNTRYVEIGKSMYEFLGRIGVRRGGNTYAAIKDQNLRLMGANITFGRQYSDGELSLTGRVDGTANKTRTRDGFANFRFFDRGIHGDDDGVWNGQLKLSEAFFEEIQNKPVLLAEQALGELKSRSGAIDLYLWLAYRLPYIQRQETVRWSALFSQFGAGQYSKITGTFKSRFIDNLKQALLVYPGAMVEVATSGIILQPSPPAVGPERLHIVPSLTGLKADSGFKAETTKSPPGKPQPGSADPIMPRPNATRATLVTNSPTQRPSSQQPGLLQPTLFDPQEMNEYRVTTWMTGLGDEKANTLYRKYGVMIGVKPADLRWKFLAFRVEVLRESEASALKILGYKKVN